MNVTVFLGCAWSEDKEASIHSFHLIKHLMVKSMTLFYAISIMSNIFLLLFDTKNQHAISEHYQFSLILDLTY